MFGTNKFAPNMFVSVRGAPLHNTLLAEAANHPEREAHGTY
jgi:hypothetical protein